LPFRQRPCPPESGIEWLLPRALSSTRAANRPYRSPSFGSLGGTQRMHTGKCVLVTAGLLTAALSAQAGSRVIVSTTLDSTLAIFDADSLAELQSPLPSKGGGPVRLWVQNFDGKDYLFAANHGAVLGSVGVLDLSGEQVH